MLQQFLSIYRLISNPNTAPKMSPSEPMFARKNKSVFDKLLRGRKIKKNIPKLEIRFSSGLIMHGRELGKMVKWYDDVYGTRSELAN